MLTATLKDNYYKNGQKVYRFVVEGTAKELAAYKAAQGDYFREVTPGSGIPLFFLTEFDPRGNKRLIEPSIILGITSKNKVVVDETKSEQILMRDVKGHLAKSIADNMAANWTRRSDVAPKAPVAAPVAKLQSAQELLNIENVETVEEGAETIAD